MSQVNSQLIAAVNQLSEGLSAMGSNLNQIKQDCLPSGRVPDALVEVFFSGSQSMLGAAKSFAELGGTATEQLGVIASAMEEAGCALDREAWWYAANNFSVINKELIALHQGIVKEAEFVSRARVESNVPDLWVSAASDFGAASLVFHIASGDIRYKRVNEGMTHLLSAGELLQGAANSLSKSALELDSPELGVWDDSCTCGKYKWESEGFFNKVWVLYKCVPVEGTFCTTCEWEKAGREVRYHSKEPPTPSPSPAPSGDD